MPNSTNASIFLDSVTENEIINYVNEFKPKKSRGYDEMDMFSLKFLIPVIVTPLTHIFNIALSTGTFPSLLKVGRVVPIYKKGDRIDPGNYRPISLLPQISKLLEKTSSDSKNIVALHMQS